MKKKPGKPKLRVTRTKPASPPNTIDISGGPSDPQPGDAFAHLRNRPR